MRNAVYVQCEKKFTEFIQRAWFQGLELC